MVRPVPQVIVTGKILWKLEVPPKVKVFWWRVLHEFLPAKKILHKRHIERISNCDTCGAPEERSRGTPSPAGQQERELAGAGDWETSGEHDSRQRVSEPSEPRRRCRMDTGNNDSEGVESFNAGFRTPRQTAGSLVWMGVVRFRPRQQEDKVLCSRLWLL
jgi:hypothetical protein